MDSGLAFAALRRPGMTAAVKPMGFVGRSVPRLEDRPLVTGRGLYAGDVSFPHQLHMRVVRSPVAHGHINSIDASAALALAGVAAVWTSADVADIPPIGFRLTGIESLTAYRQPILARDRVRYVGEPVAAVFAADPYVAEDAADLVALDIEELPAILAADAPPGEFEPGRSTEAATIEKGYGDVKAALAAADAVVEVVLDIGRHSGVPMETRGAIARYDASRDILEMHGAAKVPHWNRDNIARMLGRPASAVHLYEGHVGGGFGIRGELYPEDVLVCVAALRLGVPVKWIEDRREHLIAANHSRQQRHAMRAAVSRDGRILALDDEFLHDQGGYVRTHAATVPDLAAAMLPGPYRVPAYRAVGRIRLTNKTPGGTYRAPGRYETTFARERMMDAIAARLGIDPVELRRRNLIDKSEFPYSRPFSTLGTAHRHGFRRLRAPPRPRARRDRLDEPEGRPRQAPCRRRGGRRRARAVRGEERPRPFRRGGRQCRSGRRGRGGDRRGLGRPGRRDRGGADLCRRARRRLPGACA